MGVITRVLVANRGEIAVRVIRACREAGLASVAVYSEADREAPHVALADASCLLGPGPAAESYLRQDRILDAARQTGADAIHPGYGFLSENPEFAQACMDAGLIWIGPPPDVIRRLGNKSAAKRLMQEAGVPVVPGYSGVDQSAERLVEEAAQIGVPFLIKAVAGGGGRGMRIVSSLDGFLSQLDEARREAEAAFGDERVLLEKLIEQPHHVEFQIFGDTHANIVHLYERECSIQRRHQKIIEESPSPVLTPALRAEMAQAAVQAGRTAGYVGAGTVEFSVEERPGGDHRFYFLEVNTRLQVEHPVTEMLTGLDLVQWQFRVAQGEPLPLLQDEITARGHVIEARIYAEDAATGFLPSLGRLTQWIEPTGPGIRVDSGVVRGGEVSPFYDPMLAKIIVQGTTRDAAWRRMEQALQECAALGVETNTSFLLAVVRHPAFQAGTTTTGFLTDHLARWSPATEIPEAVLLALAMESLTPQAVQGDRTGTGRDSGSPPGPWQQSGNWRNVK